MSQRLYVGQVTDNFYDCKICNEDDVKNAKEKLSSEWVIRGCGMWVGPLKIYICDKNLYLKIVPVIEELFDELGIVYPESVWCFYDSIEDSKRSLEHPTRSELDKWFEEIEQKEKVKNED